MSDISNAVLPPITSAPPVGKGLTQVERVLYTFSAPSKTFEDIKRSTSWWLPFIITVLAGAFLFFAITKEVTWKQVYDNQQASAPAFAKKMMDQMPAEQKAAQERQGPINQEISWALSPIGLLLMDLIAAGVLLGTINFGFGGHAKYGAILSVTIYANLVLWVIKLLIGGIAIFAGLSAESFSIANVAGTNVAFYLSPNDLPKPLYTLLMSLDPLVIWNQILTAIGLSIVAGTKRSSGYIAVFSWWILLVLIGVGFAAI